MTCRWSFTGVTQRYGNNSNRHFASSDHCHARVKWKLGLDLTLHDRVLLFIFCLLVWFQDLYRLKVKNVPVSSVCRCWVTSVWTRFPGYSIHTGETHVCLSVCLFINLSICMTYLLTRLFFPVWLTPAYLSVCLCFSSVCPSRPVSLSVLPV